MRDAEDTGGHVPLCRGGDRGSEGVVHSFIQFILTNPCCVSDSQTRATYLQRSWFWWVDKRQGCKFDSQSSTEELTCGVFSLGRIKIEEEYAKNLAKLSQNSLAAQEEG